MLSPPGVGAHIGDAEDHMVISLGENYLFMNLGDDIAARCVVLAVDTSVNCCRFHSI